MEHPFIIGIQNKSLEEIQKTISDLTNKLTFAYRMGNQPLINQLLMALESYKNVQAKKIDEMIKKQNIQTRINIKKEGEVE